MNKRDDACNGACDDACKAEMRVLEETLLHDDFSSRPHELEKLLAPEFSEISANGQLGSRASVLQWLLQKDRSARWQLSELVAIELTPALRLVRYHALQVEPRRSASKGALHSSLWSYNMEQHRWQLRFHQASKVL